MTYNREQLEDAQKVLADLRLLRHYIDEREVDEYAVGARNARNRLKQIARRWDLTHWEEYLSACLLLSEAFEIATAGGFSVDEWKALCADIMRDFPTVRVANRMSKHKVDWDTAVAQLSEGAK